MKSERLVLIVGDHNAHINTMAERVRDLGHSTVRMKSLDEAINLALERHITFAVAILEVPSDDYSVTRGYAPGFGLVLAKEERSQSLVHEDGSTIEYSERAQFALRSTEPVPLPVPAASE